MSQRAGPDWLAELQARTGAVLRAPLDPSTGTLRADTRRYAADSCGAIRARTQLQAADRLAIYNRQYWFRLFGVLQGEFPLTARLLGFWTFNQVATAFLRANPPRHVDIARIADGLPYFLQQHQLPDASRLSRAALLEAATIDAAFKRVFGAPAAPRIALDRVDPGRLAQARLRGAAAFAQVTEHWPMIALRQTLLADAGEAPIRLPEALSRPRHWALFRTASGIGRLELSNKHARLLELLAERRIADALAQLEIECTPDEQRMLPEQAQRWLAQGINLGFWTGLATET
jgi:hypothetical protein